jgi:hypothetical protein
LWRWIKAKKFPAPFQIASGGRTKGCALEDVKAHIGARKRATIDAARMGSRPRPDEIKGFRLSAECGSTRGQRVLLASGRIGPSPSRLRFGPGSQVRIAFQRYQQCVEESSIRVAFQMGIEQCEAESFQTREIATFPKFFRPSTSLPPIRGCQKRTVRCYSSSEPRSPGSNTKQGN